MYSILMTERRQRRPLPQHLIRPARQPLLMKLTDVSAKRALSNQMYG